MSEHRTFVGLEFGGPGETTALAVLERPRVRHTDSGERLRPAYALRHLQRFPLGTPYPEIFDALVAVLRVAAGAWVMTDRTAIGRAVQWLPDAALLAKELAEFQPSNRVAAEDALDWRERPHDDLVLAVAAAAWDGERHRPLDVRCIPFVYQWPARWWR